MNACRYYSNYRDRRGAASCSFCLRGTLRIPRVVMHFCTFFTCVGCFWACQEAALAADWIMASRGSKNHTKSYGKAGPGPGLVPACLLPACSLSARLRVWSPAIPWTSCSWRHSIVHLPFCFETWGFDANVHGLNNFG